MLGWWWNLEETSPEAVTLSWGSRADFLEEVTSELALMQGGILPAKDGTRMFSARRVV